MAKKKKKPGVKDLEDTLDAMARICEEPPAAFWSATITAGDKQLPLSLCGPIKVRIADSVNIDWTFRSTSSATATWNYLPCPILTTPTSPSTTR